MNSYVLLQYGKASNAEILFVGCWFFPHGCGGEEAGVEVEKAEKYFPLFLMVVWDISAGKRYLPSTWDRAKYQNCRKQMWIETD